MTKYKIVGIGEILWDLLPSGKQLGGAPANFTCHAQALGADARLVSRIGDDELGREIIGRWRALDTPPDSIQIDAKHPTGSVSVELAADGQPRYTIHEGVAWDYIEANDSALKAVRSADAVCFGSLAQRTKAVRQTVAKLLAATRPEALRIFDVNLRPPFVDQEVIAESLAAANALKLNDQELPLLAEMVGVDGTPAEQVAGLARRLGLRFVALTRGGNGSLLYADGALSEHAGLPASVVDTVGAGDAFTAAMSLGFLKGWPLDEINSRANEVAAFVCSQRGATPPLPEGLRKPFAGAANLTTQS